MPDGVLDGVLDDAVCNGTALHSSLKSCETYLNGAEVDEEVGGAVLGGDEAVSLLVVEPLDGAVLALGGGVHFDRCGGLVGVGGGVGDEVGHE